MTTVDGSDEPITATGPATESDGLEQWLRDLRADLSNDPPGWPDIDRAADTTAGDALSEPGTPPEDDVEHQLTAARTTGRHRAEH